MKKTIKFSAENPLSLLLIWYVEFHDNEQLQTIEAYVTEEEADDAISAYT